MIFHFEEKLLFQKTQTKPAENSALELGNKHYSFTISLCAVFYSILELANRVLQTS